MRAAVWLALYMMGLSLLNVQAQNKIHIEEWDSFSIDGKKNFDSEEVFLLKFPDNQDIKKIKKFNYLGGNWASMKWKEIEAQNILSKFPNVKIGKQQTQSKISTFLLSDYALQKKFEANENLKFYIHTLTDISELETILRDELVEIISIDKQNRFCTVQANKRQIDKLLKSDKISFVEPALDSRTPLLTESGGISNYDKVHLSIPEGLGIKGEGINIGVWDYGIAGFHKDLEGQIVNAEKNFYGAGASQHSTFVAGAIASKGVLRQRSVGAAPKSQVYSYDFFGEILDKVIAAKNDYQVYVSNHSYNLGSAFRCFVDYGYSTASAQIDQLALDEPKVVNVFAAGNSAVACAWDYQTIVGGFQYGKNIIVVGNLQDDETPYPGSSKGPTNDGRLRPDVVAKGAGNFSPNYGIILPSPNDAYGGGWGTSFAAPTVSGIAGLMQQAYSQNHGEMPLNTTIKAVLCNTAQDLGNPGPDYEYGYGKADALQAVKSIQNGQFFESTVSDGEEVNFTVNVEEGTEEFKIFLTWNDLPAFLPYDNVLVNDLDLTVQDSDGRTYQPLILNAKQPGQNAVEGRDSLNNSEQVVIKAPVAGEYTIKIKGYRVIEDTQDFSVAYWSTREKLSWNYPLENHTLDAGETNFLRWRTEYQNDSLRLQYSLNDGDDWTEIGKQAANTNLYKWDTPSGHHAEARLRVLTEEGEVLSVSDKFNISPFLKVTGTVCDNHIVLKWNKAAEDISYRVLQLNRDNSWEILAEISDTNYIFANTKEGMEYYFSVQAIEDDFFGIRANAVKLKALNNKRCAFDLKDVGIASVLPAAGAVNTDYALTDSENLTIQLINYGKQPVEEVSLFYQINQGQIYEKEIGKVSANQILNVVTNEAFDFFQPGEYEVRVWLESLDDANNNNDTLIHWIYQKEPVVAAFPYFQDFESTGDSLFYNKTSVSLKELPEWDYVSDGNGRIRNTISQYFSPNEKKAITLDAHTANKATEQNLYLHINLSEQNDKLVYLDYKQINRGDKIDGDTIFIQGGVSETPISVYDMFKNSSSAGTIQQVKRINLTKAVQQGGQTFTDHSLLRIKTNSNNSANTLSANGGYTLDDISLYDGGTDLSLDKIDIPRVYCVRFGLPYRIPIKIVVQNHSPKTIPAGEVELYVKVGDAVAFTEYNKDEILPFDTVQYIFDNELIFEEQKSYRITAGLNYSEDFITENNEISSFSVNLLYPITHLPIELNFDGNDPIEFIPSGSSYSWETGKPEKRFIEDIPDNKGNAWVTNLNGLYPPNEGSLLYVGCLDPSLLTYNSEISFLLTYDLEFTSDGLWMEYSLDGKDWEGFGDRESGYNWYNKAHTYNIWDEQQNWQVASYPFAAYVGMPDSVMFLRFVFSTDEYIENEGVAISRFRINNQLNARINTESIQLSGMSTGQGETPLTDEEGVIYAYLNDRGQQLGEIQLNVMVAESEMPAWRDKFLMQRYFYLKTQNQPEQPYDLKLFIKNSEYVNYLYAEKGVNKMGDIGYLLYDGLNTDTLFQNNHFEENYDFFHPYVLDFWPYIDGYELRFSINKQETEIYLTGNLPNSNAYPFVAITELEVFRTESSNSTFVQWQTEREDAVKYFIVQHSLDGISFSPLDTVWAEGPNSTYLYEDAGNFTNGVHYYRLFVADTSSQYISLIDSVTISGVIVGISEETDKNSLNLSYLGDGSLRFFWNWEPISQATLRLLDVSGKIIEEWHKYSLVGSVDIHSPTLRRAPSGIYFIQLGYGVQSVTNKFIKSD